MALQPQKACCSTKESIEQLVAVLQRQVWHHSEEFEQGSTPKLWCCGARRPAAAPGCASPTLSFVVLQPHVARCNATNETLINMDGTAAPKIPLQHQIHMKPRNLCQNMTFWERIKGKKAETIGGGFETKISDQMRGKTFKFGRQSWRFKED